MSKTGRIPDPELGSKEDVEWGNIMETPIASVEQGAMDFTTP
jgi:hypothetical protein